MGNVERLHPRGEGCRPPQRERQERLRRAQARAGELRPARRPLLLALLRGRALHRLAPCSTRGYRTVLTGGGDGTFVGYVNCLFEEARPAGRHGQATARSSSRRCPRTRSGCPASACSSSAPATPWPTSPAPPAAASAWSRTSSAPAPARSPCRAPAAPARARGQARALRRPGHRRAAAQRLRRA